VVLDGWVVALEGELARAWDPSTLAEAWRITTSATSIAASKGRLVLAGMEGLSLYDPRAGELQQLDKRGRFSSVAGAPESDFVTLLEPAGRVLVRALAEKRSQVAMARTKKDRGVNGIIAVAPDGSAVFAEGRLATLPPARLPKALAIAPQARLATWLGTRLVLVEGDTPRLVDGPTLAPLEKLSAMSGSSDGLWLALGAADGRIRVLDAGGAVRMERVAHRGPVTALAFDLAANRLYSAGEDGTHSLVLGWALPRP
jgi:hypothetical protein